MITLSLGSSDAGAGVWSPHQRERENIVFVTEIETRSRARVAMATSYIHSLAWSPAYGGGLWTRDLDR